MWSWARRTGRLERHTICQTYVRSFSARRGGAYSSTEGQASEGVARARAMPRLFKTRCKVPSFASPTSAFCRTAQMRTCPVFATASTMVRLVDPRKGRLAPSHARDAGRGAWYVGMAARLRWRATKRNRPKRPASRPGLKPIGRQARCIRYHRAESYLIWDVLGCPDLALKAKITFGVSAAQE